MKKIFLTLAVFVMALCANAQKNQYFWYQGNLMMGNPIAQIDSVTFGEGEPADTLHIMLPRTIIKTVHDTVYITIHDTVCPNAIPEGALAGEFSVSADKKVRFSKGNLQYQASTDTWRFADNQYDIIGNANSNISTTYNGWIDLFGRGTGDNPTKTSTSASAYSSFTDWGNNAISNGGSRVNLWRTLTADEWSYLTLYRNNASTLIGSATVNNIHGYIILPDTWTNPNGISFNAGSNGWTNNVYNEEQWEIMEKAGALFLPATGYRNGKSCYEIQTDGHYWSTGYEHWWYNYQYHYMRTMDAYSGRAVRLVQDIK